MTLKMIDICSKIGSGATPRGGKETYCNEGVSLVRSQNVLDFEFSENGLAHINVEQAQKLNNVEVQTGDILLNITGDSVARACMMDTCFLPARVNQHVAIIRGRKDKVLNSYLLYFLQMMKGQLLQLSSAGATRNALTKGMIEQLELDLPSLPVQRKIVSILDLIQKKIVLNRQINDNLEEQAQAIYTDMFITNADLTWQIGQLSNIADITMGQSPKGNTYNEDGIGTVFFQGRAEFGFRFPTRRLYTTAPKRMSCANDVLMSVRAPVGDLNVAYEPCCIGRGLSAIHSKTGHQSFILYTMFSLGQKLDMYNEEGTIFGSINRDALNSIEIFIPPTELLDCFENIVAPMDATIRNNYEETRRLEAIRDSLLPQLMSGELDVSSIDI